MKVQNYEALLSLASCQADLFWAGGPQSDYKRVGGRRWLCAPCRKVPEALEAECGGKRREAIERQARFRRASPGFSPRAGPRLPVLPGLWGGHPCSPLIEAWVETGRRPLPVHRVRGRGEPGPLTRGVRPRLLRGPPAGLPPSASPHRDTGIMSTSQDELR